MYRWNNARESGKTVTQLGIKKNFLVVVPSFFVQWIGRQGVWTGSSSRDKLNHEVITEIIILIANGNNSTFILKCKSDRTIPLLLYAYVYLHSLYFVWIFYYISLFHARLWVLHDRDYTFVSSVWPLYIVGTQPMLLE